MFHSLLRVILILESYSRLSRVELQRCSNLITEIRNVLKCLYCASCSVHPCVIVTDYIELFVSSSVTGSGSFLNSTEMKEPLKTTRITGQHEEVRFNQTSCSNERFCCTQTRWKTRTLTSSSHRRLVLQDSDLLPTRT